MEELQQRDEYYTPDISEFHVGFEFEEEFKIYPSKLRVYSSEEKKLFPLEWVKLKLDTSHSISRITNKLKLQKVRVKYLDTDDIKELGWDVYQFNDRDFSARLVGKKYHVDMYYHYPDHTTQIVYYWPKEVREGYKIDPYNLYNSEYLFSGVVKNKSELKRILEMIKINYND